MSDNIIEFQQINMAFGKKEILNDVSFAVQKGETLAVIGPSGSGKSTILAWLSSAGRRAGQLPPG